jgi:hypothetical protein
MIRTILVPAALAALLALLTSSHAHAYGACHTGYTACGSNGAVHYGSTSAYGAYGGSVQHTGSTSVNNGTVQHTGSTTASGAYGGSAQVNTSRAYSPTMYNGYSAGGTSGYGASVTRSASAYYP